jgi:hypothetical protein
MIKPFMTTIAWAAVLTLLATAGAYASPVPAPAPLLAAGIPAFAAFGGGLAVRKLWRKLARRS